MRAALGLWAIARNDLRRWAVSASGPGFLAVVLMLSGIAFVVGLERTGEASLRPVLATMGVILAFLVPLLTAQQLSAEARDGTLELLLTTPLPPWVVVGGKLLAALSWCSLALLCTLPFVGVLVVFGDADPGVLAANYVGLFLCCAAFCAVGLFASALASEPTTGAALGIALLLPSWLASAGRGWASAWLVPVLERVSFVDHLNGFAVGVIDSGDVIWLLLVTGVGAFSATAVIGSRRWR